MPQYEPPDEQAAQLEEIIAETREALDHVLEQMRARIAALSRFANKDDIDACCMLLDERGEPMYLDEVVRELKRGGLWRGPSGSRGGADADMKRSLSRFAGRNDGQGDRIRFFGEKIGKVEWEEGQFPGPKK